MKTFDDRLFGRLGDLTPEEERDVERYYQGMEAMIPRVTPRQMMWLLEAMSHPDGPGGVLEEGERRRGATVIPLGAIFPIRFDPADWRRGVISFLGNEIRIVAIEAREPRRGALTRLIEKIQAAGFVPVVVAPVGQAMPHIVRHWGWRCSTVPDLEGVGVVEEWRPR